MKKLKKLEADLKNEQRLNRTLTDLKDLKIDMVSEGFKKWEDTFRQGDKDFDQYRDEFTRYVSKFMGFAARILRSSVDNPGKLTPDAEEVPPVSPKMMKFQASDNAQ